MKNGSYADQAMAAKLMLAGLKAHDEMQGKGGPGAVSFAVAAAVVRGMDLPSAGIAECG